ncbi:angiopoietin-related protein 3-like [Hyperolius riggenbachi]|uniref:angiopoietin-related protein 3-like n=1 Tax=Hyperolius riggenbachi TaxID=752182 RepID=UPI0035A27E0C
MQSTLDQNTAMTATGTFSLLCSICFLALPAQALQSPELHAFPREEVNLLSESLLQIGTGLRREASYTKTQINSIFKQLKEFNSSLALLSEQVHQASKIGEELNGKARSVEDNDKKYAALTEIYEELVKLQKDTASLDDVIKPLEEKVQTALDAKAARDSSLNISHLLSTIEKQNMQIDVLQTIVNNHQNHIAAQNAKIQRLQRKASSRILKAKKRLTHPDREKRKDRRSCQTQD